MGTRQKLTEAERRLIRDRIATQNVVDVARALRRPFSTVYDFCIREGLLRPRRDLLARPNTCRCGAQLEHDVDRMGYHTERCSRGCAA